MKLDHNNTYKLHCLILKKKIAQLVFLLSQINYGFYIKWRITLCFFHIHFAEFDKSILDLITHEVAAERN